MRIFYQLGTYVSHVRAGQENMLALRMAGHELVNDPTQADVAVLHDEPLFLPGHLERLANLALPVVAYCVFEAAPLPDIFLPPLQLVQEIWTCSEHSRAVFAACLPNVHVVPHVVRRPEPAPLDLERIAALLQAGKGDEKKETFWFYTIADAANRRKNLPAALHAFAALRASLGQNADRVGFAVKQYRHSLDLSGLPGVVSLDGDFSSGEIAALHTLTHCYVSPHRAEAWGLGLSEALSLGNQVIATGWSGNMTFMDERNSRLLPYTLIPVTETDLAALPPFFQTGMLWAEPDRAALQREMRRALRGQDADRSHRAQGVAERFSPILVGKIMSARLEALRNTHSADYTRG